MFVKSFATCFGSPAIIMLAVIGCAQKTGDSSTATRSAFTAPLSVQLSEGSANNLRYHLTLPAHSPYRSLSNVSPNAPRVKMSKVLAAGASFYPGDLANEQNGPVVVSATSHNVYINCEASCWGNPEQFLRDLASSSFVHLLDQYVGTTAEARYTVGKSVPVTQTIYDNSLDSNEILALVDSASKTYGSGYHVIYHVFLPKGVNTCISGSDQCYSPDNKSTFVFCAYHMSGDLPGDRHVLYTVEPYQYVDDCSAAGSAGGSPLENSTDSSLSHELFETVTDPDINAWIAVAQAVSGQEIGDLCEGKNYPVQLGTRLYSMQLEYSDDVHGCSSTARH
jgi:hypothetical protein